MAQESRLAIVIDSNQAKVDVDKLNAALKELEAQGVRVVGISDKTSKGLGDVDKSAKAASSSLAEMATALGSVVSVATLWGRIQQTTMDASRYEQLGLIMEVVGRNAGYAAHELTDLQAELQKTGISMTQSRQVITQMVQAQMDLSHATQLARLAQDAATIGNISSSEALQRLVYGVQTAQTEILRNIGVVVNFEAAYKKLADELGKTTTALTENEKMAARVNAVMEQGPAIAGAYEASMQNAGKQLGSMTRLLDDLSVAMGEAYQPAFSAAIEGMSAAIKEAQGYARPLAIGLAGVTTAAAAATTGILALRGGVVALNVALNALRAHPIIMGLSVLAGAVAAAGVAFSSLKTDTDVGGAGLDEFGKKIDILRTKVDELTTAQTRQALQAIQEPYKAAQDEVMTLSARIEWLQMQLRQHPNSAMAKEWNRDLVNAQGEFDTASQRAEAYRQRIAELESQLKLLQATAGQTDPSASVTGVMEEFLQDVQKRIKAMDASTSAVARANQAIFENKNLTDEQKTAMLLAAQAEDQYRKILQESNKARTGSTKALSDAAKAAKDFERSRRQYLNGLYGEISGLQDQARGLEDQIALYGLAESAKYDLAIADLEAQKAALAVIDAGAEEIAILERKIELLGQMRGSQQTLERLDAEKAAWETWSRDVEQIFQQVGQSLTDAIFEGGKSGRDLVKDLFKTLTLRVFIQPMMGQLQGWVTNSLGGLFGVQNPQQGGGILNIASNINSLNTLAGGITQWMTGSQVGASNLSLAYANATSFLGGDSIGALIQANGGWESALSGLSAAASSAFTLGAVTAAPTVAATLSAPLATSMATTTFSASLAGGAGAAGAAGGAGIMSGLAAAAPWIGGALAIGSAFGLFDDGPPKTRHAQQSAAHMLPDGTFEIAEWDDRQDAASQQAARSFAEQAVKSANELFAKAGVDASIHSFQTLMESSILGDKQGVGSSGQVRIGDVIRDIGLTVESSWTKHGFGGWSEAEMLPRLMTDVQLTILEAFQVAGDQLPSVLSGMLEGVDIRSLGAEQAQELAQRFQLVVDQVSILQGALEQLPFEQLRDLSFDAAANLIQFAGGLEQLDAGMTSYFQNFYSEEEKLEWAAKQIGDAFGELGLTMPDVTQGAELAKAAYRDLVESLDVTTEEGQRAYATLMTLSGGFHELATGMDQLADATQRALQEFVSSLMGDVNAALSAVQQRGQERIAKLSESFARTDAVFDAYHSQVQQLESQWGSLISTMDRSMRDLRGQVEASARLQYNQARAVISTALLTGQMPQTADLGEAIRVAQQGVTGGRYASAFDQREAYLKLANDLEGLQAIAKPELDTARATLEQLEKQYNRLRGIEDLSGLSLKQLEKQFAVALSAEEAARTQIAQIERQIAMAQAQYHELVGINDELSTLPGALQALAKAINAAAAAQQAQQQSGAQRSRELQYLADNPDVMAQYGQHGRGMSLEEYARLHYDLYGRKEGRSFDVGTSYVPYDMMANIHRGEIIIDPRSSDILRRYGIGVQGGGSSRETEQLLREQLAEVRQQNRYLYEIVKSGKRTERNTEDLSMAVAHNPSDDVVVVF